MSFNRISAVYSKYEYAFILGLVLIWQIILIASSNGLFIETDSYTHALRLMDLIQSGSWRETLYMHDNCPYGQILHFTRITDVFLYLTTLPFLPFMELKRAILFGGFLYQPVMACLSAAALIWAGRAFCSPVVRLTGLLAYFFIFPETGYLFLAGRPDHHVLLNLFLILLSGSLTYGAKTQKTAYFKMAGVWGGLAVWTSPEGFLACLFLFAGMVLAWLAKYQNIRQIRLFSQFLFITTTLCWLVNPPMQGVLYPDNSRLSVLTVAVFGFAFTSFYIEEIYEKEFFFRSFWKRFVTLVFSAFISFAGILFIFGKETLFSSPFSAELYNIWAKDIIELKPADDQIICLFLFPFVLSLFSFFCASFRLKKLLFSFGTAQFLFFLMLNISQRFARPCTVFSVFILIFSLQSLCYSFSFSLRTKRLIKLLCCLLLIFGYCDRVYFYFSRQLFVQRLVTDPAEYLPYISAKPGCVLTTSDRGPEIAWGTGRAVIGSPYHSNAQGIIDTYIILNNEDLLRVPALIKKRPISTILLDNPEYYPVRMGQKKQEKVIMKETSFAQRLFFKRDNWCFIRSAPAIPEEIREKYLIFHVDFSGCEKPPAIVP